MKSKQVLRDEHRNHFGSVNKALNQLQFPEKFNKQTIQLSIARTWTFLCSDDYKVENFKITLAEYEQNQNWIKFLNRKIKKEDRQKISGKQPEHDLCLASFKHLHIKEIPMKKGIIDIKLLKHIEQKYNVKINPFLT